MITIAYPRRLLGTDEEVALDLHPHWKALVAPIAVAVLVVGLASFGVARVPDGDLRTPLRLGALAVAIVLLSAYCVRPVVAWLTTHFVLTNQRVVMRKGFLARSGRDIPLFRINDVTFSHGIVERLFRTGTLVIESAGEHGQVTLTDIPRVEEVQRDLYRLIQESSAPARRSEAV